MLTGKAKQWWGSLNPNLRENICFLYLGHRNPDCVSEFQIKEIFRNEEDYDSDDVNLSIDDFYNNQ